jgi:hypothetical protein
MGWTTKNQGFDSRQGQDIWGVWSAGWFDIHFAVGTSCERAVPLAKKNATARHHVLRSLIRLHNEHSVFLFSIASRRTLGRMRSPIQWVPEILLGDKAARRQADHSPPSNAEVKNTWSYTSTLPNVFMAWCLIKHRGNCVYMLSQYCYTCEKLPLRRAVPAVIAIVVRRTTRPRDVYPRRGRCLQPTSCRARRDERHVLSDPWQWPGQRLLLLGALHVVA